MIVKKKCLLMIGSPRGFNSTSYKLGNYVLKRVIEKGFEGEKILLKTIAQNNKKQSSNSNIDKKNNVIQGNKETAVLLNKIRESEIIILSSPLYVDSLPSFTIEAMELIAAAYQREDFINRNTRKNQGFLAIVNSGFPESEQNETALQICQRFASEIGIKWLGGIRVGGGPAIGNQEINGSSGMLKDFVSGVETAVNSFTEGTRIPAEALELLNKSLSPKWIYTLLLNPGWWFMARKNKAQKKLYDRPYL